MPQPTASILEHFKEVTDARIERQKLHQLLGIIVIAICAVICGADTWVEVELFGQSKLCTGISDRLAPDSVIAMARITHTPPSAPFECDGNTQALWHFNEITGTTTFHDACGTVDNMLVGYNGAHSEGVPGFWVYLPLVVR